MSWTEEDTIKFVKFYRDHKCLWDVNNADYNDKQRRLLAYQTIAKVMNLKMFGVREVKRKIKYLRRTYNEEMQKENIYGNQDDSDGDSHKASTEWFGILEEIMKTSKGRPKSGNKLLRKQKNKKPSQNKSTKALTPWHVESILSNCENNKLKLENRSSTASDMDIESDNETATDIKLSNLKKSDMDESSDDENEQNNPSWLTSLRSRKQEKSIKVSSCGKEKMLLKRANKTKSGLFKRSHLNIKKRNTSVTNKISSDENINSPSTTNVKVENKSVIDISSDEGDGSNKSPSLHLRKSRSKTSKEFASIENLTYDAEKCTSSQCKSKKSIAVNESMPVLDNNKSTLLASEELANKSVTHAKKRAQSKLGKQENTIPGSDSSEDCFGKEDEKVAETGSTYQHISQTNLTLVESNSDECISGDSFQITDAITSTVQKKRIEKSLKKSDSPKPLSLLNNDEAFKKALKELKFKAKGQEDVEKWTDGKNCVLDGNDIEEGEEKRGTYTLENSVLGMDTLKELDKTNPVINTVTERKRTSIGQRISKRIDRNSPPPRLSVSLKAKTKIKKPILSNKMNFTVANGGFSNKPGSIKRTKMPNFSLIHQRQWERSESIVDYVQRTNERSKLLLSGSKPIGSTSLNTKNFGTVMKESSDSPLPSKKKSVTYAMTPKPEVANKKKLFAKTPGKHVLGKSPVNTPVKAEVSEMVSLKSPQPSTSKGFSPRTPFTITNIDKTLTPKVEVTNKTPNFVKTPGKNLFGKLPTNTPVKAKPSQTVSLKSSQPSTSNAFSPHIPFTTNKTDKTVPKKQPSPKKHQVPRIPKRLKTKDGFATTSKPDTTNLIGSKIPLTNKENNAVKSTKFGSKMRPNKDNLKAMANKVRTPKVEPVEERRTALKGVRSNRRFDLLMKLRKQ